MWFDKYFRNSQKTVRYVIITFIPIKYLSRETMGLNEKG